MSNIKTKFLLKLIDKIFVTYIIKNNRFILVTLKFTSKYRFNIQ